MIFQAYKLPYSLPIVFDASSSNDVVLRFTDASIKCVPAAPVRSSFAEAFKDVECLRSSGYIAAVRTISFNQITTI